MPSQRDELDSYAIMKAFEYQKGRNEERKEIRKDTDNLGKEIVKYIIKDLRGETKYDESLDENFIQSIQNTAADPVKNDDLINSIQNIIYAKFYRVEHPRYRQLLQLDFEANLMAAVGGHSQVETAIANETEVTLTKKTRIHTFIASLKKALGQKSEDEFWTT